MKAYYWPPAALLVLIFGVACTEQAPGKAQGSNTGGNGGAMSLGGSGGGSTTAGGSGIGPAGGNAGANETGDSFDTGNSWTIISPDATVRATVELSDKGGVADYPSGQARLYYTVQVGGPSAYREVIEASPLGILRSDTDLVDGLSLAAAGRGTLIDETYEMPTGKKSRPRNHAHQRVLEFRNAAGAKLELVLRAYDDGFAFRYRFPEQDSSARTVTEETTGFRVPDNSRGWMLPYDVPGTYEPAYENTWRHDLAVDSPSPTAAGWCLPALFRTDSGDWMLLAETDVDGSYFGAHLGQMPNNRVYQIAMPLSADGNSVGEVIPSSTLPWQTPWRIVIAGTTPAAIVESTLPTDLAAPSVISDVSWIRPGRVSWSWWSSDSSPSSYSALTPFVDLAADMTWEYSLIDTGWQSMANGGTWRELASYAATRNVGLMLWYNSGGSHNTVALAPRNRMHDAAARRAEFQTISSAGIRGVKVDFFHSDKPWMMQYYRDILEDAADYELLVNFHGSTIQRGWQRTYPHLMTTESVRGAEWYKFDASYPAGQPQRNTILVYTRNVMGSMDFTPVTFTDHANPHTTTNAHELALSVVFESGLQHFADRVSGYTSLSSGPRTFLQQIPTTWDDTRFLQGEPGRWVVLARRKDRTFYLGAINGEAQARDVSIDLSFLGEGTYSMTLIGDGATDRTFSENSGSVSASDSIEFTMRPRGGFVARFSQ